MTVTFLPVEQNLRHHSLVLVIQAMAMKYRLPFNVPLMTGLVKSKMTSKEAARRHVCVQPLAMRERTPFSAWARSAPGVCGKDAAKGWHATCSHRGVHDPFRAGSKL